jgi:hypothetical protein
MSINLYYAVSGALAIGCLVAFAVLVVSFIAVIVTWKTPRRRVHLIRALVSLLAIPALVGIQQAVLWFLFIPELGRQQMAQYKAFGTNDSTRRAW